MVSASQQRVRRVNEQDDTATILPNAKLQSAQSIAEECFETGTLYYPEDEPGFPLFYKTDEYWEALRDAEL